MYILQLKTTRLSWNTSICIQNDDSSKQEAREKSSPGIRSFVNCGFFRGVFAAKAASSEKNRATFGFRARRESVGFPKTSPRRERGAEKLRPSCSERWNQPPRYFLSHRRRRKIALLMSRCAPPGRSPRTSPKERAVRVRSDPPWERTSP